MTADANPLVIQVHLEDGRITRYAQPDANLAHKTLARIQPTRFFAEPVFLLDADNATIAFQTAKVVRVDFLSEGMPRWSFPNGIVDVQEITRDEFRQRYRPEDYAPNGMQWMLPLTKTATAFVETELVNGAMIYTQVHARRILPNRTGLDESIFLHRIFASGGLHLLRAGGGVSILNPSSIVRIAFYPGAQAAPAGAWQVMAVAG